ncbi:MAG: radical SAM protein [Desulfosalsimonadaceae bacterium]
METDFKPTYLESLGSGELAGKIKKACALLEDCTLCPRQCHVNRTNGETGICNTAQKARVSSIHAHFGEEPPLVGTRGSGTLFFTGCNLMCNFCQNWDISHEGYGEEVTDKELGEMMLALQKMGCHNINLVTPTHVVPQILSALEKAAQKGLYLPLVYNSSGYDRVKTLAMLDGIIDIYMPDFKFWDENTAEMTCDARDYPETARAAIAEMHRQVGDLVISEDGMARRGLLVRHLVMPEDIAGTRQIMRFIARSISKNTYVNVMSQYRPAGRARDIPALSRPLAASEYRQAVTAAREEGIVRFAG